MQSSLKNTTSDSIFNTLNLHSSRFLLNTHHHLNPARPRSVKKAQRKGNFSTLLYISSLFSSENVLALSLRCGQNLRRSAVFMPQKLTIDRTASGLSSRQLTTGRTAFGLNSRQLTTGRTASGLSSRQLTEGKTAPDSMLRQFSAYKQP